MTSLFRRLARYPPGLFSDPAENRLTETLAALLAASPAIARHLASLWVGHNVEGDVRIATQVPTASAGFVDLQLRFETGGSSSVVWVEVKLGAEPYEAQLYRYIHDMARSHPTVERTLVLLIPDGTAPPPMAASVSQKVVLERWQAVGRGVRAFLRSPSAQLTSVERWLAHQFVTYLEEEGLESATGLRAIHLLALSHAKAAEALVIAVRREADDHLAGAWEQTGPDGGAQRFYRHCRPIGVSSDAWYQQWRGGWFEWGIARDAGLPDPRGDLVFGSGYTIQKKRAPLGEGLEAWIAAMRVRGFELVVDDMWRLYRFRYPEAFLASDTVEAQGEALGKWVGETFEFLRQSPVPPADA